MGVKDANYQIVYRGEVLNTYKPGRVVFFQREKEYGGGYWLGQTFDNLFLFVLPFPVSLNQGINFLVTHSPSTKEEKITDGVNLNLF